MTTKEQLFSQLESAGIKRNDVLLVHSSMKAFGRFKGNMDELIDAFCEYLSDGLFILPTHTWDSVNKRNLLFDKKSAVPCVGLLPKTAVKRKDGVRSSNPTHSVVVFGKEKEKFIQGEELISTPTPRNGCYGKLIDYDGAILLLGVGHNRNTFLHCLEETANLPYRLSNTTTPFIDLDEKKTPHPMKIIHCPYCKDVSAHYPDLSPLLSQGADTYCTIGEAPSIVCRAKRASELLLPVMIEAKTVGSDYLLPDAHKKYVKRLARDPLFRFVQSRK